MTTPHRAPILRADDPAAVDRAAARLRAGGLVAFPTETVYGLGADATQEQAVARIFEAKDRPRFNPLIAHCADLETAAAEGAFDQRAQALAEAFWPGPMTLVLPRRPDTRVARLASAGLDTVALRVPAHPQARALLAATGRPVAAPSANRSGTVSPTTAQHVAEGLGDRVDLILDGGPCGVGVESTVVDLTGADPVLLRPGGVPAEQIEARIGRLTGASGDDSAPHSPGRLPSHYAPDRPLRLAATEVRGDEGLLAFGPEVPPGAAVTRNLSPTGDLREAAANLFALLRDLDRAGVAGIAAMPVPDHGLGRAINDRLRRAAAPRG
jgi:L-threonylcarbamoyladenylate synthase